MPKRTRSDGALGDREFCERTGRTRREYLTYGGALVGGAAFAGCLGGVDSDPIKTGSNATSSETPDTRTRTEANTETATESATSRSVTMEPVGTVEFDELPETWFPYTADYADMGVALGQAEGLLAVGVRARFATHHYEELPNVTVDRAGLTQLWQDGTGKEVFYELDADLHVIDPNFVRNRLGWSRSDVDEVEENVAPFLGNTIFTRAYDWHDYPYYSMYEAFEKLAAVFGERDRYEAFARLHESVRADVRRRLPDERPDVAVLYPADVPPDTFWPYLVGDGTQSAHWRDLNVDDALARHGVTDAQAGGGTVDYELLLEIDPEVIAIRYQGETSREWVDENLTSYMREHEVASELRAVQNDRVVYGGVTYQGPIISLFQLERAAQGLYPDAFVDEQLFDRRRVADIVAGEF